MPENKKQRQQRRAPAQKAQGAEGKREDAEGKREDAQKKALLVFAYVVLLFALAQVLGIYSGNFIIQDAKQNEVVSNLRIVSEASAAGPESAFYLLFWVLAGAGLMILIIRFYKGNRLFQILEFSVVSFASSIVFYSLIRPLFGADPLPPMALAAGMGLALAALKLAFPVLKNPAAVLSTAGAGAVFGFSLTFLSALVFLILLSLYDYIAVFKTKHMVEMARSISKREMPFVVTSRQMSKAGEIRFELGTGDMLMPIVLEVTGLQISPGYAAVVFISSIFALFALFALLTRQKSVLPALPVIALFNIVFLAAAFLLRLI